MTDKREDKMNMDSRGVSKTVGRTAGLLLALPSLVMYWLWSLVLDKQRAFALSSEHLAKRAGMLGVYTRQAFYRYTTGGVGRDVCIGFMTVFSKPALRIGQRVYIGRFCSVGWAVLQDDVMLADGVQVLSGRHQHGTRELENTGGRGSQLIRDNKQQYRCVTIGRGAWIGAGAVVMADVGAGAVVAAGAVVVNPVAAGVRVGGVPAKTLGSDRYTSGATQTRAA